MDSMAVIPDFYRYLLIINLEVHLNNSFFGCSRDGVPQEISNREFYFFFVTERRRMIWIVDRDGAMTSQWLHVMNDPFDERVHVD